MVCEYNQKEKVVIGSFQSNNTRFDLMIIGAFRVLPIGGIFHARE